MSEEKENPNIEQTILEVAERLFLEKGFELTSTTRIAKEVGCNQALIHYYFRTKENLFNKIFETKFRNFFQQVLIPGQMENLNFTEKIGLFAGRHFEMLEKNPNLPFLIMHELRRQPKQLKMLKEKLHSMPEQFHEKLNHELQQEIEAGRIRKITVVDILISIISMNIALFIMMPVVENLFEMDDDKKQAFIQNRKKENINFILNSLRP